MVDSVLPCTEAAEMNTKPCQSLPPTMEEKWNDIEVHTAEEEEHLRSMDEYMCVCVEMISYKCLGCVPLYISPNALQLRID